MCAVACVRSMTHVGVRLVQHCLDLHTALNHPGDNDDSTSFPRGSMWEYVDDAGHPYADEDGAVISDPGHAVGPSIRPLARGVDTAIV